jgi:hypothetical protein
VTNLSHSNHTYYLWGPLIIGALINFAILKSITHFTEQRTSSTYDRALALRLGPSLSIACAEEQSTTKKQADLQDMSFVQVSIPLRSEMTPRYKAISVHTNYYKIERDFLRLYNHFLLRTAFVFTLNVHIFDCFIRSHFDVIILISLCC